MGTKINYVNSQGDLKIKISRKKNAIQTITKHGFYKVTSVTNRIKLSALTSPQQSVPFPLDNYGQFFHNERILNCSGSPSKNGSFCIFFLIYCTYLCCRDLCYHLDIVLGSVYEILSGKTLKLKTFKSRT